MLIFFVIRFSKERLNRAPIFECEQFGEQSLLPDTPDYAKYILIGK